MNQFLRILIAALVACNVSASAEQTSLGDVAREAEKRKETPAQPSKTYTNDDLRPAEPGPSAGCQPAEHKYRSSVGQYLPDRALLGWHIARSRLKCSHWRSMEPDDPRERLPVRNGPVRLAMDV